MPTLQPKKFKVQFKQPKKFIWLNAQKHIDLYDNQDYVTPAINHATQWFNKYLI